MPNNTFSGKQLRLRGAALTGEDFLIPHLKTARAAGKLQGPARPSLQDPGYASLARNSPMRRVPSSMFCLVTVPGEAFGTAEHIRISYPVTKQNIDEGTRRIGEFLARLA